MIFWEDSFKNAVVAGYGEAFEICSIEKSDKYLVQLFESFYTWLKLSENNNYWNEVNKYCRLL